MALLNSTREILRLTEELSGRPVRVQEDQNLTVLATMRTARGDAPIHTISYRPIKERQPDYHIAYQCGFLLRLFQNPPNCRFEFALGPNASVEMDKLVSDPSLPPDTHRAKDMLVNGLLTQLRSVPIGLRIDEWLWSEYPELQQEQIASARLQLQQNASALHPSIRRQFPRKVVDANTGMNSAYAHFWAVKLKDNGIDLPYRSIGADTAGKGLMDVFSQTESDALHDQDLVDRWANALGLHGWYRWVPYNLND